MLIYLLNVFILVAVCIGRARALQVWVYYYAAYITAVYFGIFIWLVDITNGETVLRIFIGYILGMAPMALREEWSKRRQKAVD